MTETMSNDEFSVILFYSSSYTLRAEKTLERFKVKCKLVPVPRHLSSDCGVCLRISRCDKETALDELSKINLPVVGVHDL